MQEAECLHVPAGLRVRRAVRCHCCCAGLSDLHRLGRAALTWLGMYFCAAQGAWECPGADTVLLAMSYEKLLYSNRRLNACMHTQALRFKTFLSVCAPHKLYLGRLNDLTKCAVSTVTMPRWASAW